MQRFKGLTFRVDYNIKAGAERVLSRSRALEDTGKSRAFNLKRFRLSSLF